jgi:beta-N-acetylhexosaminidase
LFSKTPLLFDPVWTFLVSSMKEDAEFRQSVRAAARRILTLKLRDLRGENKVPYIPDLEKAAAGLPDPQGAAFFMNLAARSVNIVKPSPAESLFPLTAQKAGRVLLAGQYTGFFRAGRAAFPGAGEYQYSESQSPTGIVPYARNADTIIFCLSDAYDVQVLRALETMGKKVIVLSVLSPVHLESVPWVNGAVAVYSYASESFAAGFSAIIGRIPARGILPYSYEQ